MAKSGGQKIGRSAKTGKFIPVERARRQKSTSVVETLPKRKQK